MMISPFVRQVKFYNFHDLKVGLPTDQNGVEEKNLAADIGGIAIKDETSNCSDSSKNGGFPWKDKHPNNATFVDQATVGSLTFSVIDASCLKPSGIAIKDDPQTAAIVATVGSLTFNVIDASCLKSSGESSRQVASVDAGAPAMKSEKARSSTRKSAPRAKVPFEKGYSQMDWLKLTQTHPDLAGLKGQSNRRLVSMSEVKQNQKEGSMWTVLKGRVYNISPYMKFHPGGLYVVFQLQFDKSVDHYATEFSNLFISVGLNETTDQLRARYLVSLDLSIRDELGMVCVYNLEDARCYDLQAEKRVLLYVARRPLSSRVDGVSKGSYCGKETASSSKVYGGLQ
ncbi:hypothetical protein Goklo_008334 [Gossypium klotzschianum]|uniref:Cytochrome b5 heme-binding domain-containing protein n=1 Tax=Gossypium klotzschianum TaxID=34286 RepID=A0A7J8UZS0_9ROSI|nr:hypothetical protein [Gossypium klotzschianum]